MNRHRNNGNLPTFGTREGASKDESDQEEETGNKQAEDDKLVHCEVGDGSS